MSLNISLDNIRKFLNLPRAETTESIFRVTVVAFEDKCNMNCGRRFAEILKNNPLFDVNFFDESFPKGFLNLQGRNFFDFIDRGNKILSSTHSDVLVWGYEENGKIRLNFQIADPYIVPSGDLSYSLLDSLFIPLNYLTTAGSFSESVLLVICGIIIAAVRPVTNDQKNNKQQLLKSIIELLAADTSPKDISREFMPYIMNMLGKIYLSNTQNNLTAADIEIIKNLFETALKDIHLMTQPIYYGCVYHNMAQLYECAYHTDSLKEKQEYLKLAIAYYQEAHKYLNKNYPYDYGLIAYHLAELYYDFWKQTNDLQALRDAVSQMREAEKVYTKTQFTPAWCHVEGRLGYFLASLGMVTKSNDIMQLAINSYSNQQEIYEQRVYPMEWSAIQEEIGHIYYLLGKQNEDETFMLEARNYFNSALDVYNELKAKSAATAVKRRLAKIRNYID